MFADRLTARGALAARKLKGLYRDGKGLILIVNPPHASWILRFVSPVTGRRRDLGLGAYPEISLAEARQRRDDARQLVRNGIDPLDAKRQRKARTATPTLAMIVEAYIAARRGSWRSEKHAREWSATVRKHAVALWDWPINQIDQHAIVRTLAPIWLTIPVMAPRVRARLEVALEYAAAHGHRTGDNPASLKALTHLLPVAGHTTVHHRALEAGEMPALLNKLSTIDTPVAQCLLFLIFTAARSAEARGALWAEIKDETWVIASGRMKAGREHRVPLSRGALTILASRPRSGPLVFPSKDGAPTSSGALRAQLRRLGYPDATVHGMRSVFSSWAHDSRWRPDLVESALAHDVGSAVERAYNRGDRLRDRAHLMETWSAFVTGQDEAATVLPLRSA